MHRLLKLILVAAFLSPIASAQQQKQSLREQLTPLLSGHQGEVGFFVKHLTTGEQLGHRPDEVMPTASLCKLATMVATYRRAEAGTVDLKQKITLRKEDMVPGSGILTQHFSPGATLSLRDAIRLMIVYSDNTATNLVTDAIGLKTTSDEMVALGFPETKIHSKVFRRETSVFPNRSKQYGLGSTTARETVRLLEQLHNGTCAGESSCKDMLEHLKQCDDDTKIAAGLPAGTKYAHKTGAISAVRCDAGIIYSATGPIALCVLTNNNKDKSWTNDNAAHKLCANIGRIVFEHFNPPHKRGTGTATGPLQIGSFGETVEMLQRTLNARLEPSPQLSVDGDFGPGTEGAVRQFQESKQLAATGIVDRETWKALGTLVPAQPMTEPAIINAETLPVEPADGLSGVPFLTCRGFAITDAETGELLFGNAADIPREPASTTKIMTAWLITKLATQQPGIVDEVMTFSERADQTRGSTSGLRAGEKVVVREAIYGLMLPSGNDMSVALAEHFGRRLTPGEPESDPLALFVTAMNAEALRLGMHNTHYENPHGWPHPKHVTSPFDLARLARTAFESELFRGYVRTRQRGVKVEGPGGYTRNVVWKNSNRLLAIKGYDGVKTGTTTNAGACLVSTAKRGKRRLIVSVLGSTSSDARYVDTRNLYRWAWTQLSD